jgi:late competence protein required for DNA uptake (superfamily II DNA/RNA helicase)
MAISNFQEKLLFYTQQKSRISMQLSDVQMRQLSASKTIQTKQQEFNAKLSALYYDEEYGYGTDEYSEMLLQLQSEHEFELASINSWESQLDIEKENLETQLNEIQSYESTWQKLLSAAIKTDFVYGGIGGK